MSNRAAVSILVATISAGGAFGGYMYFKPSNLEAYLKWKGYTLAKAEDENLWKSIYQENKDSFLSVFGNVKEEDKDKWKVIKEYCTKALKKNDYFSEIDKSVIWCLDNVKTVEGQIVRNGKPVNNFMDSEAQFKVASAVQGNPAFWRLLEVEGKDFEEKAKAFQKWCTDSLKSEPKNSLVGNVDAFCRKKPYETFHGKLKADGYSRLTPREIKEQYAKLEVATLNKSKTSKYVLEIVGQQEWEEAFGSAKLHEKVNEAWFEKLYTQYCKKGDEIKIEKEDYEDSYSKYRGICAKEINPKKTT